MASIDDFQVCALGEGRYEVRKAGRVFATTTDPDWLARMFPGTAPSQPILDALLTETTRVRVWSGGAEDDLLPDAQCLADIDLPAALALFRALLVLAGRAPQAPSTRGPTLELLSAAGERVALLVLGRGQALRWKGLADGWQHYDDGLNGWLEDHGVVQPRAEYFADIRDHKRWLAASDDWYDATPAELSAIVCNDLYAACARGDLRPALAALAMARPKVIDQMRALLRWFGSGVSTWNDFPAYELCAEVLLRTFPWDALLAVVAADTLDDRQLDGATRLLVAAEHAPVFPPWTPRLRIVRPPSVAPIAVPVAAYVRIVAHCRSSERLEPHLAGRFKVLDEAGTGDKQK